MWFLKVSVLKQDSLKFIEVKKCERCEANYNEGNSAHNEDLQNYWANRSQKVTADLVSFRGAPVAPPRICSQDTKENSIVCKCWWSGKRGHRVSDRCAFASLDAWSFF